MITYINTLYIILCELYLPIQKACKQISTNNSFPCPHRYRISAPNNDSIHLFRDYTSMAYIYTHIDVYPPMLHILCGLQLTHAVFGRAYISFSKVTPF